jgi:hypothetical protein
MSRRRSIKVIEVEHNADEHGPVARVRRGTQKHLRHEYHNLTRATRDRLEHVIDGAGTAEHLAVISLVLADELWIGVVRI